MNPESDKNYVLSISTDNEHDILDKTLVSGWREIFEERDSFDESKNLEKRLISEEDEALKEYAGPFQKLLEPSCKLSLSVTNELSVEDEDFLVETVEAAAKVQTELSSLSLFPSSWPLL